MNFHHSSIAAVQCANVIWVRLTTSKDWDAIGLASEE